MKWLIQNAITAVYKTWKFLAFGYKFKKDIWAKFAKKSDIAKIANAKNRGVLIDGKSKRLSESDSFKHIAIVSPPGWWKTTAYIVPNILDKSKSNCSMLITDPSGEIYKHTSGQLKSQGFEIKTINPMEQGTSSHFNPFDGFDHNNLIEIEATCASIILSKYGSDKEQVWNDWAILLLEIFAKCLAYSCPKYLTIPNINYLIQMFWSDGSGLDDWIAEHSMHPTDEEDRTIIDSWKWLISSNANMLNTYSTIAKTALKQFNNPDIQKLFYWNDIDFEQFRKKKTAVYIVLPENQASYFQFLIDVFYAKFFTAMMEEIPSSKTLDVFCFLDEFWSSYVDNFSMIVNNIRKYRVSLSLVFQGLSQIEEKYGLAKAKSIKAGISSTLVFAGADHISAKEISDRIGEKVTLQRKEYDEIQDSYAKISLISADKIRTLNSGEALFLSANRDPFIVKVAPFYISKSPYNKASKKAGYILPIQQPQLPLQINIWTWKSKQSRLKKFEDLYEKPIT